MELSREQKIYAAAAVGVGAYALFVYFQRKRTEPQASFVPAPYTGGTVDYTDEFNALQSDIRNVIGNLQKDMSKNAEGLAGLIESSNKSTVDAINNQSSSIVSSLSSLAQANAQAFTTLSQTVTKGFSDSGKAMQDSLNAIATAIGGQIQQLVKIVSDTSSETIKAITSVKDEVGKSNAALATLTTDVASVKTTLEDKRLAYIMLGSQSVATCLAPDGSVDATCVKTHAIDLPNALFPASSVPAYVKQKYPNCMTGNVANLACVGEKIAKERGMQ
jgi:hypothetical protein